MKWTLYDYQRDLLWSMYACGYRRVLTECIDPCLHHRAQSYLTADLAGYITEHMGQPMTKKEIRQNVTMLAQLGVKPGRAKSEGATMAAVKEELKKFNVQIVKYGERKHQKGELQYYTFAEL